MSDFAIAALFGAVGLASGFEIGKMIYRERVNYWKEEARFWRVDANHEWIERAEKQVRAERRQNASE